MKLKSSLCFIFALSLVSCATDYNKEKTVLLEKNENADLVNSFDLDKEKVENFKTITAEELQKKEADEKAAATKKLAKEVPAKKTKTPKKVEAKAAERPVEPVVTVVKTEPAVVTPPAKNTLPTVLPPNYPEEFKAYDAKSQGVWEKFKPVFYQGEQSIMAVTYLGVTAGYITILSKELVALNNEMAYHYYARFKSSDSYRYFYWLDDKLDTYVEKDTFLPMKYSLVQREKKQNVDDLQLFDFKKMMTYHWYKRVKEGSNKDEKIEKEIPRLSQDSFSALQFVRGLPLVKGDIYEFPVVTRGKFWLLKVEVMGLETTSVNGKDVEAIRIRAETNFPGVLKKSGDIIFWYGNDAERKLLKFQAKIKLGSIYGELVEYKPGVLVK